MCFDYCEEYFRNIYIKENIITTVQKSKCSFICHLQIDKKSIIQLNKNIQEEKLIQTLLMRQFSGQLLGQIFYGAHKSSSCLWLSPSLRMITLNPLPFCSSRSHKYSNYDKVTYIVSSNLCLFFCLRPGHRLSMKSQPTKAYQC